MPHLTNDQIARWKYDGFMSPFPLLLPDDPVYAWRERMLGLFDGYAAASTGFPV